MRTKVTLLLLLLNVVVLAWIVHARHRWQLEDDDADGDRHPLRSLSVNLQSIEITEVTPSKSSTIRMERPGGKVWNLTAPYDWLANPVAVEGIITELQSVASKAAVEVTTLPKTGQTLADYGLDKPELTFAFTPAPTAPTAPTPTTVTVRLSAATKAGNLYLLSPDGKRVHVLDRSLLDRLADLLIKLPDPAIFTIRPFEARVLGLEKSGTDAPVRLIRDGPNWKLGSPIVTRASKADTEIALAQLAGLRLAGFDRDPVPPETLRELQITMEGDNRHETLLVGQPFPIRPDLLPKKGLTLRYAKLEDRATIIILAFPDALFDTLARAQETLRDPHVLGFDPATVTTITLAAPTQPTPLVLQRLESAAKGQAASEASWQMVRPAPAGALPADSTFVKNLLLHLAAITATRFASDAPSAEELENFGFNRPEREITLAFAPDTTPAKLTLEVALDTKGDAYARVAGQAFIYAVSGDTLGFLPVSSLAYRDRLVRALPASAQITGLTFAPTGGGTPIYSHTLSGKETWTDVLSAEKPPARRTALEKLLLDDKDHRALLRVISARHFARDTYESSALVNGVIRPWAYQLTVTAALPDGTGAQTTTTSTLFFAEQAGSSELAGSPPTEADTVFELEPPLMDALQALSHPGLVPPAAVTGGPQSPVPAAN